MEEPTNDERLLATRRPDGKPLLHQSWHHLGFIHWEVPVQKLAPLLPPRLTLDVFQGHAYVGLVPFAVTDFRAHGLPPFPFFSKFYEVNVRTYVHVDGREPGVWFFSLDASTLSAVLGARATYHLPYYRASMDFVVEGEEPVIAVKSKRETSSTLALCELTYAPRGATKAADVGTFDFFLAERYILYAESGGKLFRARVHHSPYPLQRADANVTQETLLAAAGIHRTEAYTSVHYAKEVDVDIWGLEEVP